MPDGAPAAPNGDLAEWLRAHDVQPTRQRLAIAGFFAEQAHHATAAQVKAWADGCDRDMSLATVYNTLNCLTDAGLLRAVRLPHTDHTIYDRNATDHHHLLDEETGELMDLPLGTVCLDRQEIDGYRIERIDMFCRGRRG